MKLLQAVNLLKQDENRDPISATRVFVLRKEYGRKVTEICGREGAGGGEIQSPSLLAIPAPGLQARKSPKPSPASGKQVR